MALVYHNITPPEYFIGVHKDLVKLCFRGRRELTAYIERCDLALGDSEYNRAGARGARLPAHRRAPGRPGLHAISTCRRTACSPRDFDDGWTNVMFVGRVIPNKKFEDVIRAFHAYRTRHNPRSRLLLVGSYSGFERYLAMLHALIARLGTPDVHFLGHVSNEELTALYDVADLFLCASEHEGFCVPIIEAFHKGVPVLAYAVDGRARDDGRRRRALRHEGSVRDRAADGGGPRRRRDRGRGRRVAGRRAGRGCAPKDFGGTLLRFVDQVARACRRARRRRSPGTSGRSSTSSSGSRSCGSSGRRCIGRCLKSRGSRFGARSSGTEIAVEDTERRIRWLGPGRPEPRRPPNRGLEPRAANREPRARS